MDETIKKILQIDNNSKKTLDELNQRAENIDKYSAFLIKQIP